MKYALTAAVMAGSLLFAANQVHAQYVGPGQLQPTKVNLVKEHGRDDARVVLQGRIVAFDGHKRYVFEDETGRMPVKIPAKLFAGLPPVDAQRTVEIQGEVDRDWKKLEVEAHAMRLLQP